MIVLTNAAQPADSARMIVSPRPERIIMGISAILLPFLEDGQIDWDGFSAHVARTAQAGLMPAVNMDTGYVNLLDEATRRAVLERTHKVMGSKPFTAGAFVGDKPDDPFNERAYLEQASFIQKYGGIPTIFQSFGLTGQSPDALIASYQTIARECPKFIAFELGLMFAPFGKIYDLKTYEALLDIPECIGAKHSSLSRIEEWKRIAIRDAKRPDFKVFTGNDLAIDMVMYGSDYLLGLSTFAPDLFAKRDAFWATGDPAFYELNDLLQYIGFFAFRAPVPAYKHTAAQFLKLRGWIGCDLAHPRSPQRPVSDIDILREIVDRLGRWEA